MPGGGQNEHTLPINTQPGYMASANSKVCFLPIKVGNDQFPDGGLDKIYEAIEYAVIRKAHIISLSIGGPDRLEAWKQILKEAELNNILVVAAAGNDNTTTKAYPAGFSSELDNVLAVAALDRFGEKAYFSSKGDWVNISAPGVNIYSGVPPGNYRELSGTSMATPLVASVASLLYCKAPAADYHRIKT